MSLVSDVCSVSSLFFAFSVPCSFFLAKPHRIYWVKGIAVSRPLVFANKGLYSQSCGFPSCHVWMWELDHEECRAPKNWCFWTAALERTRESSLDCGENRPAIPALNIHWEGWCWSWRSNALAAWCKEPTHWKRPWCWERWKAKGEGRTEDEVIR